ncbi:T-complex 11 [Xylariaceae sp. FL0804]|nr:T-complex 11 [Xylariaceae sp. FL0804]
MGEQGPGGLSSQGIDNNTRRHSTSHDEQLPTPITRPEASKPEGSPQKFEPAGPRSTALARTASTHSNSSFAQKPRPLEPPVTKGTLSELDVQKIIHNPKLRHDINFDPELHFRPNLDGEKGKRKQEKANLFWDALSSQLDMFIVDRDEFMRRFGHGEEWCLPLLLKSVKEIIQTLVPNRDRMQLDEGLNVDLIMQQFGKGLADLEKLASWLSGVLKSHCAPMRDEWVDEMYNQLTNGNRTNDMKELVNGMRSLLSVLEAMKLDVANHQIRCLRPILIEDTVQFEQRFFLKKIRDRKLDPTEAQVWYHLLEERYPREPSSSQAFGEMAVFFEALSGMILPKYEGGLPNTFLFDEERICKLRSDMLDAINLEVCMRLYEDMEREYRHYDESAMPTPYLATPSSDASGYLSAKSDDEGSEFNFNTSRPSSMVFSSAGSASSSPRSSLILSSPPAARSLEDQRARSRELYNSLVALLQTSTGTRQTPSRWKALKDSLALQVFRYTNAPTQDLMKFEQALDDHLSQLQSPRFQAAEQYYHRRLLSELQQRVKEFRRLTGVSLFSVATGGRLQAPGRGWDGSREGSSSSQHGRERETADDSVREGREEGGVEDMATRLAHVGLLHWRVWSPIAYVGEAADGDVAMNDLPVTV